MKEVDPAPDSGKDEAARKKPQNGKLAKDLKGLVYQGGSTGEGEPIIDKSADSITSEPAPETDSKQKVDTKSIKDYDIMNFSENEGSSRKIIIAVIALVIIGILVYFLVTSKGFSILGPSTLSLLTSSTTVTTTSGTTSTIIPTNILVIIKNVDLFYNYTGPLKTGNYSCGATQHSTVDNPSYVTNALKMIVYTLPIISSGRCAIYINKILITTPGFKLVKTVPSLPQYLPPNSTVSMVVQFNVPPSNFTGPLSVRIDAN